jgi:hypothetical protein
MHEIVNFRIGVILKPSPTYAPLFSIPNEMCDRD